MGIRAARRIIPLLLIAQLFSLTLFADEQSDRAKAQAAAAAGAAAAAAQAAMHAAAAAKARAEMDQAKAAEETAKMAAQLAQMAANLAAAGGNKKGKEAAKAADPTKAPEVAKAAEKAETKESPKIAIPSAPEQTASEVVAEAEPETLNVPAALVEQVAANHPEEVAPEVFDRNFDSGEIPDSIPRTKIGYDESNPTGGSKPNAAASDTLAMGSMDGRAATAAGATSRREKTEEHGSGAESGVSDSEDGGSTSASLAQAAKADFKSMLGAILGAKDETTGAAGGNGAKDLSALNAIGQKSRHPQLAETGVRNIFEYASQSYGRIAKEEKMSSKSRVIKPSYIANVRNVK